MRSFKNLFIIKTYQPFDVIRIGTTKFIFLKCTNIKEYLAVASLAKSMNYLILIVQYIDDIYMFDENLFDLARGFIIIYK